VYYVDLGAAYVAHSLRLICAELGIQLVHTAPRDCEAKGAIERWHRSWREEVGDELPESPLSLEELNARHLWRQLKKTIGHMVDNEGVIPMLILDEAQHLCDDFFEDLAGFLNYAFDTRDLLTVWLVGLPPLATRLRQRRHAALATRIVSPNELRPRSRDELLAMVDHGLRVRGATQKLLADPARELLWRVSRGLPREASKLLRQALFLAHERDQAFVDENVLLAAIETLQLERPTQAASASATKPRARQSA
jgi:hypothetical protein